MPRLILSVVLFGSVALAQDAGTQTTATTTAPKPADARGEEMRRGAELFERAKTDPVMLSRAETTRWCFHLVARQQALDSIKEERKASKIAGVVNLGALHEWQTTAHSSGKAAARIEKAAKARKVKLLNCSKVEAELYCYADLADARCEQESVSTVVRLAHELDG